jgi:hypothetical protein
MTKTYSNEHPKNKKNNNQKKTLVADVNSLVEKEFLKKYENRNIGKPLNLFKKFKKDFVKNIFKI